MAKQLWLNLVMEKKFNMRYFFIICLTLFSSCLFSQKKYIKPNINISGNREIIELNSFAYINGCLKIWSPKKTDSLFSHKLVNGDYNYGMSRRWEEPVNVCLIYGYEWRLPTISELELISKSVISNLSFSNFGNDYFLSSTTRIEEQFPYEGDYKKMYTSILRIDKGYGKEEYHEHFGRTASEDRYKVVCVKTLK